MISLESVFWLAAGLLSVAGVVRYVLYPVWRELRDLMSWWRKFQRDWDGESEEPGRARVPGVMERLNDTHDLALGLSHRVGEIEVRQREIADRIGTIESQGQRGLAH